MFKLVLFSVLVCYTCTSCCSMTRGSEQQVTVTSNPPGASIVIDGYSCGTTPQSFLLKRKYAHDILITKEGYQSKAIHTSSRMSPVNAVNLLIPVGACGVGAAVGFAGGGGAYAGIAAGVLGAIGLIAGSVVALGSFGIDYANGATHVLDVSNVHAELLPTQWSQHR